MSDQDKESKTEDASEKKISDAVEKGNVPFSREATLFASLLGILASLAFVAGPQSAVLAEALARFIDDPAGYPLGNGEDAQALLWMVAAAMGTFLLPAVAALALAGLVASLFQNTPSMVLDRITPQWSRVSPTRGWTRIFGSHGQVEFGKSLFKFAVIAAVCGTLIASEQGRVLDAVFTDPIQLPATMLSLATRLISAVCVVTILLVAVDLVWSRLKWRQELRMTKQEVKEEFRQSEGDPMVKARMRSLAQERARRRMMNAVPNASLVIANPTHYAIALRYDRTKGGAPLVVAKGLDLIALKIREIAERNGVPVIEDKQLARAMYDAVEVDKWIPPEFYRPVANILYYIYSRGKNGRLKS
ncbi:flagellar biosynthesis protein FlhB [Aquabacter spiritensis]|uniref:Flagellar biosynthetic protein FlhB n=1 Tax=Aquabacter spiritensis TaxID=933073 RepID=A0A4R3M4Z2_9HYPH|nr:flagellar biosynthesis protein FlhB [Aquabacter spiritensis]TCT07936.1 flagellar biosynthetic protein FlhB [Aquabacter spiritensis]